MAYQGYFFSKPVPVAEFEVLLNSQKSTKSRVQYPAGITPKVGNFQISSNLKS
jgi:hypothetical protein